MISDNISTVQDQIEYNLYTNGIHYLSGEIGEFNTSPLIQWIIGENANPTPKKHLTLYINSIGGDLYDAFAVIDVMNSSKIPIRTIGIGSLMSAAFMIFVSGERGSRSLAKNTSTMCHQFSSSYEGKEHDIKASERETRFVKQKMLDIIKNSTDMDERTIKRKLLPPSDVWLSAQECIDLGVADILL
jgi:ATP-dependent Clp protease protease subunit